MDKGYTLVRPLAGGLDAWMSAGYAVEADPLLGAAEGADAAART